MEAALNVLTVSVFIVDAGGRLQFANAKAECLLSRHAVVRTDPGSRLHFLDTRDQRTMMDCFHRAPHTDHRGPRLIALKGSEKGRFVAFVSPLVTQPRELTLRSTAPSAPSNSVAVVIIDSNDMPKAEIEHVAEVLAVTPAEARLALALLHDKTLQDYADERNISVNTVRVQLRSLLDKTDTHRQGQLINLLAKLFTTVQVA
jgi:DNA-binding CsgD family transcriptional regulator